MPVIAVLAALVLGGIFLLITGKDPFGAYGALFTGAFGGTDAIAFSLVEATPLILAGLAVGLSFRSGFFNIGAGGQLAMGALAAGGIGAYWHLPAPLLIACMVLGGGLAGAAFGAIAGLLRAYTGASEIIVTLMLNYVALQLIDYMVTGPWKGPGAINQTRPLPAADRLPALIPGSQLTIALLFALAAVGIVAFLLFRTTLGYELRMVGLNQQAARAMGMSVRSVAASSLTMSGFLAGVAGAVEVAGVLGSLPQNFSIQVGFDAIAAALLGANNPLGILIAALFLGCLQGGAPFMEASAGVSAPFIQFLEAIIIASVVVFPFLVAGIRFSLRTRRAQAETAPVPSGADPT
jgi:simple sugar transport system permease protein